MTGAGSTVFSHSVVESRDECHPIAIGNATNVPAVRQEATAVARAAGFGERDLARVAVVATEMATNLAKHAHGGRVRVRRLRQAGACGVELVASDRGPGIVDTAAARVDGYSTANTLGGGLGAIARLSDESDLFSVPLVGTIIFSRLWATGQPRTEAAKIGTIIDCAPGEDVSGDGFSVAGRHGQLVVLAVDGLGHGPQAHLAATTAVECFDSAATADPEELLALACRALIPTRGAAAAVAAIDFAAGRLRYCGIGNIAGTILGEGRSRHLVSHAGIVGNGRPRLRTYEETFSAGARLVMASDGLHTRWEPVANPGVFRCHPQILASALARDHTRGRDDVLVIVAGAPEEAGDNIPARSP